jgi:fumarylacetoacetase
MTALPRTLSPDLRSWVDSANDPRTDFPIQNLPLGVFVHHGSDDARVGVAIGDQIADVRALIDAGLLDALDPRVLDACKATRLNALMGLERSSLRSLRLAVSDALSAEGPIARDAATQARIVIPAAEARLLTPAAVENYTDFYASIEHATNLGSMFRPDNPLLPNYKWVPIGYHGRASSIVVSGTEVKRPLGQTRDGEQPPSFGPTARLDYELEVGAFVARGNRQGERVRIEDAEDYVFGFCLVNDWSARDIQAWEYQPLGPFLGKSFATTVSPWVVMSDALVPYRVPARRRAADDPAPLPYLFSERDQAEGGLAMVLEVSILSQRMRESRMDPYRVSIGAFNDMYWTTAQLIAHHTSNGCNLRPGDLLASGTVSGPTKDSRGSLIERTWRGSEPLTLSSGESRAFLADGDEVIIRGWCERQGHRRIGFGECRGRVAPADAI